VKIFCYGHTILFLSAGNKILGDQNLEKSEGFHKKFAVWAPVVENSSSVMVRRVPASSRLFLEGGGAIQLVLLLLLQGVEGNSTVEADSQQQKQQRLLHVVRAREPKLWCTDRVSRRTFYHLAAPPTFAVADALEGEAAANFRPRNKVRVVSASRWGWNCHLSAPDAPFRFFQSDSFYGPWTWQNKISFWVFAFYVASLWL
jgi:hypothetical protein